MPPKYSDKFRRTVVREFERLKSATAVAKAFGIDRHTVIDIYRKFGSGKIVLRKQNQYTDEFKKECMREIKAGKSVAQVSREQNVSERLLRDWRKAFGKPAHVSIELQHQEQAEQGVAALRAAEEAEQEIKKQQVEAERTEEERVRAMLSDPLLWLQRHTKTKDSHWREHGADSPYRHFPDKPYFRPLMEGFQANPVIFVEKSRDLMLSWLFVGLFTHAAMTTEGIEVLFQSQKQEKACELVEYSRILYEQSDEAIRKAYPLARKNQATDVLEFAHGSRIIAIPGGGDQIRSYHPWGLLMDEAAFMPEAGESYDNAVPVCKKIVVLSSAGPGWFADMSASAT